jgi:hypothetical protein
LQAIFTEYNRLTDQSGLQLNADKTEIINTNQGAPQNYVVNYLNKSYDITSTSEVKINGILFQMDPEQRMTKNVEKVASAMDKQLQMWSSRHLTLLGKILIIKTFVIAQMIYLMQTIWIDDAHMKIFEKMILKFLWNRSYSAAKAPERLKRSIVFTPIDKGGLGLLNIFDLRRSLTLKCFSRLLSTSHPFFSQIRENVLTNRYFKVSVPDSCDKLLTESTELLMMDRQSVIKWPTNILTSNLKMVSVLIHTRLTDLLTPAGKRTIVFFNVARRNREPTIRDLTQQELTNLTRFVKFQSLIPALTELMRCPMVPPVNEGILYPVGHNVTDMSKLTSKEFRLANCQPDPICIYKSGLILNPVEVHSWTKVVRKLTSVRHRCNILRVAHGDIYSNDRLHRFGMIDNPKCLNCPQARETIKHKLIECPTAKKVWRQIRDLKSILQIDMADSVTLEEILGVNITVKNKLSLAINAEIITRILAQGGKRYSPQLLVSSAIKTISLFEPIPPEIKKKCMRFITENYD